MKTLHEPTLEHLDLKIITWLLSMVFIGIALSVLTPDFSQDRIRVRGQRVRVVRTPTARRKV